MSKSTPPVDDETEQALREIVRDEMNEQSRSKETEESSGVSRRSVLSALGLTATSAAAGGLGTLAATDPAAAQSSYPNSLGTPDDPLEAIYVDQLFQNADNLDVNSINTEQATIGPLTGAVTSISWDRPEVLDATTTVEVPQDEPTPQDAFRKIPRRLAANHTIEIDETDDYSVEDWVVPPVQSADMFDNTEGGNSRLTITRQGSSGTLNPNSVFTIGGRGQGNTVHQYTHPVGTNPWDDENSVWAVYGGEGVKCFDCGIGGTSRGTGSVGVDVYGTTVKLEGTFDWGSDLVEIAGQTKQFGTLKTGDVNALGSVTGDAWVNVSGRIEHRRIGPSHGGDFAVDPQRTGGVVSPTVPTVTRGGDLVDAIYHRPDGDVEVRDATNNKRIQFFEAGGSGYNTVFYDGDGNKLARLTESGDLILDGAVTENGDP
ncbi:hypothetical protein SAMN06269185_1072 [Natronoarchaeum philippinense]|uniref:Uncharacterized protein n=1 Tax=Natronoarchaeum philippinense TaxID=558529 RepID=A0A285NB59_NATPI|nr:hypothetical protein [Natronoarchaeum philippinense]SNZ06167.1 hypothetical protein SAMN06269185_1072 [Natronoarchaeum philippinense]